MSIDFTKPNSILDWAAYHKFDQLFNAKYNSGKLTMGEYLKLIDVSIAHVECMFVLHPIKWFHFKSRYLRKNRLDNLIQLRNIIYNRMWRYKAENSKQTLPTLTPWGGEPINTSKNSIQ